MTSPPPPGYVPYGPPPEDTVLPVLAHLSVFAFALLGPLVLYLTSKDDPYKPMTAHHAREALNFHITLTLAFVVSIPLLFVIIGIFTMLATIVVGAVFGIIAAVAAGRREPYRYPLCIRFVS